MNWNVALKPAAQAPAVISPNVGSLALAGVAPSVSSGGSPTAGATIFWDAPTQNADNSSLTDLIGYYIYRGAGNVAFGSTTLYRDDIGPASVSFTDPAPLTGTASYYVTAIDSDGDESAVSGQILKSN